MVDHHAAEPRLPPALAVVNPNRCDQTSPRGDLAAVGVTFLVVVALNRTLRARGHFARRRARSAPLARSGGARHGLRCGAAHGRQPGAGRPGAQGRGARRQSRPRGARGGGALEVPPSAEHFGFVLGPRLNAGGRTAARASRLSCCCPTSPTRSRLLVARMERAQSGAPDGRAPGVGCGRGQPAGARGRCAAPVRRRRGLVAGRGRPRRLAPGRAPSPAGAWWSASRTASARAPGGRSRASISARAVIAARQAGCCPGRRPSDGGGPHACGPTLEEIGRFLSARLARDLGPGLPPLPDLTLDGALQVKALSPGLAARLGRLGAVRLRQSGAALHAAGCRSFQVRRIGEGHLDCVLQDAAGGRVRAVAFRAADRPLGEALLAAGGAPLHLAGTLKLDHWQGQPRVTFRIEDAARCG